MGRPLSKFYEEESPKPRDSGARIRRPTRAREPAQVNRRGSTDMPCATTSSPWSTMVATG